MNTTVPIDRVLIEYGFDVKILNADSRPSDLKGYTNLVNNTLDVCAFLKNPMQVDPISYLFYKIFALEKKNKIFNKCPIQPVIFVVDFEKSIKELNIYFF